MALLAGATAWLALTGCEPAASSSSSSSSSAGSGPSSGITLSVTPRDQILSEQQPTATLTASRGTSPYNWTCATPGYGTLSATTGSRVTYTASRFGDDDIVQTITVTDSIGRSESVRITQNYYKEGDTPVQQ